MPADSWAHPPTVEPHGYGFSIPVAVTETEVETDDGTETRYDGIRVEVRSLASVDVAAGIDADPDAGPEHLAEALGLALDAVAPTIQGQLDDLSDLVILGGV